MAFEVRDEQDRVIIIANDKGKIAISRFPDLSDEYKEYIIGIYVESTGEDSDKVRKFLNYEDEGGSEEFCS